VWVWGALESINQAWTSSFVSHAKVNVPSPVPLVWDACSMTHLETHFPMHKK
jgi:hypothetical protein